MGGLPQGKDRERWVTAVLLAGTVLVADMHVEPGVAVGVAYVLPVLLMLWSTDGRHVWYWAAITSVLVGVGLALSPPGGPQDHVLLNRGLSLVAIWLAALLVYRRKRVERRWQHRADHDPLTGLLNREAFRRRLEEALARAGREEEEEQRVAVCFIDLDRFKEANDRFGHHVGDRLLACLGRTLRTHSRRAEPAGRLGGDEFAVIMENVGSRHEARLAARRLLARARKALRQRSVPMDLTASIGVACYPDDGTDADTLLRRADRAMYDAKRLGGARCLAASRGETSGRFTPLDPSPS